MMHSYRSRVAHQRPALALTATTELATGTEVHHG